MAIRALAIVDMNEHTVDEVGPASEPKGPFFLGGLHLDQLRLAVFLVVSEPPDRTGGGAGRGDPGDRMGPGEDGSGAGRSGSF